MLDNNIMKILNKVKGGKIQKLALNEVIPAFTGIG